MRRFEAAEKFWEIWIDGSDVLTRFGKLGANGQTKVKSTGSLAAARAQLEKMVEEKVEQGFREKGASRKPKKTRIAGKRFAQCDPDKREALARKHWPKGITKSAEMNERFRL
ncbi:MAG: WGR domain-containing protein, partial [Deltaproteobacteria bacterium]|nr:WGR domain-containing protein [Deltaproteobacteria bacterium]